jgi:hypothetical protein
MARAQRSKRSFEMAEEVSNAYIRYKMNLTEHTLHHPHRSSANIASPLTLKRRRNPPKRLDHLVEKMGENAGEQALDTNAVAPCPTVQLAWLQSKERYQQICQAAGPRFNVHCFHGGAIAVRERFAQKVCESLPEEPGPVGSLQVDVEDV